jgi:ABC-type transport system involved in multi-copper enzyme maturation permease subunit
MIALVHAEILKLIRRRGTMIWCLLLTVGVVLLAAIIVLALHAANPDHHGPAGGVDGFEGYTGLLAFLGSVAAIIIGSTAGSQDVQNGVFRDLVVTGRKRSTLFNVRTPGALAVLLPMLAIGFLLALAITFVFAGSKPTPGGGEVAHVVLYLFCAATINLILAVGLAAFVSARIVVGVLIAWNTIVSHILISIKSLGGARDLIDVAAAEQLAPRHMIDNHLTMSAATAVLVLVVWAVIFLSAGRFWTNRRDA